MPDTIYHLPLADIDPAALARDRTTLDEAAQTELRLSIAASGLRMPIEVFPVEHDEGQPPYALLSGFRRLTAVRTLHEMSGDARHATIPAFVRQPANLAAALASMVEENEIREDLSPWERGRIAVTARDMGLFPTIEAAVDKLYPAAERSKRTRLRALARLVEEFDGAFAAPETLSLRQALRLEGALRAGLADLVRTTLSETRLTDPGSQWQALLPILAEAERPLRDAAAPSRPGRPRRVFTPRPGLTIRREMSRDGYNRHRRDRTHVRAGLGAYLLASLGSYAIDNQFVELSHSEGTTWQYLASTKLN